LRCSCNNSDLSLATSDTNVSFLQQVTIERPKSNGGSQGRIQLVDATVWLNISA
jgi:hypothetical protein